MHKIFSAVLCLTALTFHCAGQSDAPAKKYNHYIGFQANELLQQLFNFSGNNNAPVENPYLLVYSISKTDSRWGLHAGFGYDYSNIVDVDAPVSRETKVNDLFARVGLERKFSLGKKFEGGYAFDLIMGYKLDKTFSLSVTNTGSTIDSSETTVTTKVNSYGFGPQVSIAYYITEKVLLGTEASLYYTTETTKQNILAINKSTQIFNNDETISTSNSNAETNVDKFSITIPMAIFLIVKF